MKRASIIVLCSLLASCETMVEIDIPSEQPKMVVNAVFTPDSTWFVTLHSTHHIITERGRPFTDLVVSLRDENGQEIALGDRKPFGSSQPNMLGWSYESTSKPEPGMTYEIQATSVGFDPVSATAMAPITVDITDAFLDSANMVVDEYMQGYLPLEFTFQDPPGLGDYYYPQLYATYEISGVNPDTGEPTTLTYHQIHYLYKSINSSNDIIEFDDQSNSTLIDNSFDGKLHTVRLFASVSGVPGGQPPKEVRLNLYHASEEYFKYFKSIRLQNNSDGNPFAQPVQVYTNIDGGVGIFAGYTRASWEFIE